MLSYMTLTAASGRDVRVEASCGDGDAGIRLAEEAHGSIEKGGLICSIFSVPSIDTRHLDIKSGCLMKWSILLG
jgi:hypothetical protein